MLDRETLAQFWFDNSRPLYHCSFLTDGLLKLSNLFSLDCSLITHTESLADQSFSPIKKQFLLGNHLPKALSEGPRHFIPPSLHFSGHFIPKGKIVTSYQSLHTKSLHTKRYFIPVTSYQAISYRSHFIPVTSYRSHFIPSHFIPVTSYQSDFISATSYQCTSYQCTSYQSTSYRYL